MLISAVHQSDSVIHINIYTQGSPAGAAVKNLPANAGVTRDMGSIPESGRSPREGNGNLLQYSYLEIFMDRGTLWATVLGVTRSQT